MSEERVVTRLNEPWSEQKKTKKQNIQSRNYLTHSERTPDNWNTIRLRLIYSTTMIHISREQQRSLSARVTFDNTREHNVSCAVLYFLPLQPFIWTSFVDSIETWYITRRIRASLRRRYMAVDTQMRKHTKRRQTNDAEKKKTKPGALSRVVAAAATHLIMQWKCVQRWQTVRFDLILNGLCRVLLLTILFNAFERKKKNKRKLIRNYSCARWMRPLLIECS